MPSASHRSPRTSSEQSQHLAPRSDGARHSGRVMAARYAIGIDFGTESGRALLVDVATGRELASSVYPYQNGVITECLPAPDDDVRLGPDWALQDPMDYVRTLQHAVPAVLAATGVDPAAVIGIGIDFTACTMLPTTADGTPLARDPRAAPRPARVGEALEAPRRATRGGPDQRRRARPRRGVAAALRRQDLVGVVLQQEPPDPRRVARHLSRRGPADRGDGLGGLAAHRRRDPQQLHGRLQGDLVEGGRVPGRGLLRGARAGVRRRRRRQDVAHDPADRRSRRLPHGRGRGLDGPPRRDRRSRSRTWTRTPRCRRRR